MDVLVATTTTRAMRRLDPARAGTFWDHWGNTSANGDMGDV